MNNIKLVDMLGGADENADDAFFGEDENDIKKKSNQVVAISDDYALTMQRKQKKALDAATRKKKGQIKGSGISNDDAKAVRNAVLLKQSMSAWRGEAVKIMTTENIND